MVASATGLLLVLWFSGIRLARSEVEEVGAVTKVLPSTETFQWEKTETKNGNTVPVWNSDVRLLKTWKFSEISQPTLVMNCAQKTESGTKLYRAILYIQRTSDPFYVSMATMDVSSCDKIVPKSILLSKDLNSNIEVLTITSSRKCTLDLYDSRAKEYLIEGELCPPKNKRAKRTNDATHTNGWVETTEVKILKD